MRNVSGSYRFISFFLFPNKKVSTKEPDSPLDKSITYMKENISRRLTTEDIAEKFNYSPSHYTAIFKQKTGMSPIDYYIKLKIHYACQLLTQSELKIKEISDKIGYDDPYYFSRLFKQIMGKSPKEYRKVSWLRHRDFVAVEREFRELRKFTRIFCPLLYVVSPEGWGYNKAVYGIW